MTAGTDPEEERRKVAAELQRVRDAVRARALDGAATLPSPLPTRTPEPIPQEVSVLPAAPPLPPLPDNSAVNALWDTTRAPRFGWRGRIGRALEVLLRPGIEAQVSFNSRQVQFDNGLLTYVEGRLDAIHRQYDDVLGIHRRHMAEIDERHLVLQEELVSHVHDLVGRIDLVLAETERGRLSLEFTMKDLRARLLQLEERLARG